MTARPFPVFKTLAVTALALAVTVPSAYLADTLVAAHANLALGSPALDSLFQGNDTSARDLEFSFVEIGCASTLLAFLPRLAKRRLHSLGFAWPSFRVLGIAALAAIGIMLCDSTYQLLLNSFPLITHTGMMSTAARSAGTRIDHDAAIMALLSSVLVAPVCEEIGTRAFLFNALRAHMPIAISVVISACVFALLHQDLIFAPFYFLMGVVLAEVYRRTNSIVASMLTHAIVNLVATLPRL
jgi:membrane protease YdiL (CAAX protease family)